PPAWRSQPTPAGSKPPARYRWILEVTGGPAARGLERFVQRVHHLAIAVLRVPGQVPLEIRDALEELAQPLLRDLLGGHAVAERLEVASIEDLLELLADRLGQHRPAQVDGLSHQREPAARHPAAGGAEIVHEPLPGERQVGQLPLADGRLQLAPQPVNAAFRPCFT